MRHLSLFTWTGFALAFACSDPADLTLKNGRATSDAGSAGAGAVDAAGSAGMGGSSAGSSGGGGLGGAGTGGSAGTAPIPPFSSGLPADTLLNALISDQLNALCTSLAAHDAQVAASDAACRYAGDTAALLASTTSQGANDQLLQQVCQAAYHDCAQPPPTPARTCSALAGTCTATVQELEQCVNDIALAVASLGSYPACNALTLGSIASIGKLPTPSGQSAACTALSTSCPGL